MPMEEEHDDEDGDVHVKQEVVSPTNMTSPSYMTTTQNLRDVKPTEEAFLESFDIENDAWSMYCSARIIAPSSGGEDDQYKGESGRKIRKRMKTMLPMDLVLHMVHSPNPDRVPEYRMVTRLLRTLAGLGDDAGVNGQTTFKCIYLAFPSLSVDALVTQLRQSHIILKGMTEGDMGTIVDRIHMSAYVSGGKRRVSRKDSSLACVIRKCSSLLNRTASVGREVDFGGMDVDE